MQEFDLVVIGGGSAGLKAARTAAKMGRTVAIAEEQELGGECFWAGCVPTKAMVRAAQVWNLVRNAKQFGITTDITSADFADAMAYKNRVVMHLAGDGPPDAGLSKLGVAYYPTHARFESTHEVRVGKDVIFGHQIILAAGTVPTVPNIPGLVQAGYITNRNAVELKSLPKRLVILGGGPIGLEFAQIFRRFGSEVTVVEHGPQILPREDAAISALAEQYLTEEGIRIYTGWDASEVTIENGAKLVHFIKGDTKKSISCDEILVAAGRDAALGNLNIEATGIHHHPRHVFVDEYLRTCVPHIWAAGDISGGYLFTHVASYEGRMVAQNAFAEQPKPIDLRVVPRCTFIDPEVASVGLTEREARESCAEIATYSFSFADLDRAVLHGEPRGLVKIVVDRHDNQILGGHIIGTDASSLIAEITICMQNHLPITAISETMHAYPSFPEAVEAAALYGPD